MPSRATHVEARLAELPVGHPRQRAASHHPYYRPPRPGLSVSHHARRPLVPGAHAWRKLSPHDAATMVVSDELPKAPKEREKVNFFLENLSLLPETRVPKEHFKLVFGFGTSDLAKIRPLKNRDPAITWKSSLYGNFHRISFNS